MLKTSLAALGLMFVLAGAGCGNPNQTNGPKAECASDADCNSADKCRACQGGRCTTVANCCTQDSQCSGGQRCFNVKGKAYGECGN